MIIQLLDATYLNILLKITQGSMWGTFQCLFILSILGVKINWNVCVCKGRSKQKKGDDWSFCETYEIE